MIEPAHARYRERLATLAADAAALRAIAEVGTRRAWWSPHGTWVRTYGRFDPDHEPFATLVFETTGQPPAICRVEAFEMRPAEEGADESLGQDEVAGWLRVSRFPLDPALPTLPAVLDGPGRPTIVRYRPRRRCTIRLDDGGRTHFAKVYSDDLGERVHAETLALWRAAGRGELGFSIAEPDRWDPRTRTLWQGRVDGSPMTVRRFGAAGPALAHRLGRAAASLTRSEVRPRTVFDGAAQLARSIRQGEELSRRVPRLAAAVSALLEMVAEIHAAVGCRPLRPIHGAPHAHQWLVDGPRLGLVDFDKLALGDPELDAATVLAELGFEDHTRVPVAPLAEAFRAGYESVAGPLDRRLLAAYGAHRGLAKALTAARALRPDGDRRVERKLGRAIAYASGERG